jgi:hypothetical protein
LLPIRLKDALHFNFTYHFNDNSSPQSSFSLLPEQREESKLTIIVPKSKNLTLLLLTFKGHLFFLIIQNRNNLFVSSAKMNLIM